ncbi:MAG: hypothetical protein U0231_15835 [Nitrospiraceae bacterium]
MIYRIGAEEFSVIDVERWEINQPDRGSDPGAQDARLRGSHQPSRTHHPRSWISVSCSAWLGELDLTNPDRRGVGSGPAGGVGGGFRGGGSADSKNSIEPPPNVGTMAGAEFTQGGRIEDRLLILVDLNRLLLNREAAV